jgi:hypothetical protein
MDRMRTLSPAQLDAAERFVWVSGRLIDRLRFACLFRGGSRERVLAALRPYQNGDGGFGEALEPDFRGPVSQPAIVDQAFRFLDELNGFHDPMVHRACDYLPTISLRNGGLPIVLANVPHYPHAPWWEPGEGPRASLLPTGGIAGLLHKHRIEHPWLAPATEFCWTAIDALTDARTGLGLPYVIRNALVFLDHVPDRPRAKRAATVLGERALQAAIVALDPRASGEVHFPLDYAPEPQTLAGKWFDDGLMEKHLDALIDAQEEDGGWTINWPLWTPMAGLEWRGWQTIHRLKTLRAYGRFPSAATAPGSPGTPKAGADPGSRARVT